MRSQCEWYGGPNDRGNSKPDIETESPSKHSHLGTVGSSPVTPTLLAGKISRTYSIVYVFNRKRFTF